MEQPTSHVGDTLGIFGAGRFGTALARRAVAAGLPVAVALAGTVARTARILHQAAPGAVAASAADLVGQAELLVLAVPLHRFRELPLDSFAGHTVIDVMNYWAPVDGDLPEYRATPSSLLVRDALPPGARLAKAFNHLSHRQVADGTRREAGADRVAVAISADEVDTFTAVARLAHRLGFDPVPAGGLESSGALEPGSPIFGRMLDADTMRRLLAAEKSTAA